jgi:hypothetical protein
MSDLLTLDEREYDYCDLADEYDAREAYGLDPDCSDEEVEEHEQALAEDCLVDEYVEEWKWQRHRADVRRFRLTGAWRVRSAPPCRPLTRARSSRARRPVRRTARTTGSRGDPDDAEPGGARRLDELVLSGSGQ